MLAHSKCHRDPQDIFNWLDAVAKFSKDDILDYMQLVVSDSIFFTREGFEEYTFSGKSKELPASWTAATSS
eukprot:m.28311 g.28311  ORF g.28311 m.28311 type:complete len:71 (+) comp30674_c0_seq4:1016-1228(+)